MQWAFIIILIVHMRANIDRDMAGRNMCVFLTMAKTLVKNKLEYNYEFEKPLQMTFLAK